MRSAWHLFLLVLLTFFVMSAKLSANPLAGAGTVGDFMETGGEEFLMDSETTGRLHLVGKIVSLGYAAMQKAPICNEQSYASCLGEQKNIRRGCAVYNRAC
nr:hypothetical protein MIMGU_mgv11b020204mg [Ipomoea trifida]